MFDNNWGLPDKDKASLHKRIKELERFLDRTSPKVIAFHGGNVQLIEFAASRIGYYYWDTLFKYVRPVLGQGARANRYKVAALLELCIARVKPFRSSNKAIECRANAQFGMMVASAVINDFAGELRIVRPSNTDVSDLAVAIRSVLDDHEDAMFLKNDNISPILLNSGYWHSLDWLCASYHAKSA